MDDKMSEQVWVVMDDENPVAVYRSESLADKHAQEMGCYVMPAHMLTELPADVTDPTKVVERAEQAARKRRVEREHRQLEREQGELALRTTIVDVLGRGGKPSLCHCDTFSISKDWLTDNGYCRYCGGFTPEVFRLHCGEDALFDAIDLLAHHDRLKMREIVGPRRDQWPEEVSFE